jgi:hypothetical protein
MESRMPKHGGCTNCKSTAEPLLKSGLARVPEIGGFKVMHGVGVAVCSAPACRALVEFVKEAA